MYLQNNVFELQIDVMKEIMQGISFSALLISSRHRSLHNSRMTGQTFNDFSVLINFDKF